MSDLDDFETKVPVDKDQLARGTVIRRYQELLKSHCKARDKIFPAKGEWFQGVTLKCMYLPSDGKSPAGFTKSAQGWQYDLRSNKNINVSSARPKAYRIPFLKNPNFDDPEYTVSHLCHDNNCMNPEHHTLELLAVNKARNGCPGGSHCHHQVKCLIPGPYYDA